MVTLQSIIVQLLQISNLWWLLQESGQKRKESLRAVCSFITVQKCHLMKTPLLVHWVVWKRVCDRTSFVWGPESFLEVESCFSPHQPLPSRVQLQSTLASDKAMTKNEPFGLVYLSRDWGSSIWIQHSCVFLIIQTRLKGPVFETCTLFNNVLLMAPQTQVGFYIFAEEAAGMFSKLQFRKAFASLNLQEEINRRGGGRKQNQVFVAHMSLK